MIGWGLAVGGLARFPWGHDNWKASRSLSCIVQGEEHFSRGNMQGRGTKVRKALECSWDWTGGKDEGREQGDKSRVEVEL